LDESVLTLSVTFLIWELYLTKEMESQLLELLLEVVWSDYVADKPDLLESVL
jgi:hypothetical protein